VKDPAIPTSEKRNSFLENKDKIDCEYIFISYYYINNIFCSLNDKESLC